MAGEISVKGGVSKTKIFTGPESHKLHLEFDLSPDPSADAIHRGQPVILDKVTYDGSDYDVVLPAPYDCPQSKIIGISIHELDSAYTGAIVVAARGYVVVYAQISGAVEVGQAVKVGDGASEVYDSTTGYCIVKAISQSSPDTELELQYGWALETATDGDVIKVLVKN